MKLVKQVEACETWEDVIRVTKAVFNYSKDEQFEMLQQLLASMDYQQDDGDDVDSDDDYGYSEYDEEEGEEEQDGSQSGDMKGESGSEKQEAVSDAYRRGGVEGAGGGYSAPEGASQKHRNGGAGRKKGGGANPASHCGADQIR